MADREPNKRHEVRASNTAPGVADSADVGRAQSVNEGFDDAWDAEQQDNNTVPLTRTEAEKLFGPTVSRPSRVTPFKVVTAQVVLSLVATLLWWLFYKPPGAAALSAFLGGAVCWVPSALFAARLRRAGAAASILTWMVGEAVKMGVTVAMFVAIALWYHDVRWLPLLVTYLVALKTYWIALAWH
jgi:ATP synthase protein I